MKPKELPDLIEKGGVDGPVTEDSAVRTLSTVYAAIEADTNLSDDKKEMIAEIFAGAYTRLLRSRRSLIVTSALPFSEAARLGVQNLPVKRYRKIDV